MVRLFCPRCMSADTEDEFKNWQPEEVVFLTAQQVRKLRRQHARKCPLLKRRKHRSAASINRRSCCRVKNRELEVKKAWGKGGQAGVVGAPACVLSWDSADAQNAGPLRDRTRRPAHLSGPTS
jgi:hypothetical protein